MIASIKKSPLYQYAGVFWYLLKFLLCYFVLYGFYIFYEGLVTPGGRTYSPFLQQYFDVFKWQTIFLTRAARLLLMPFYDNINVTYDTLRIDQSRGIRLMFPCLGIEVMSFWIALVFANTGKALFKLRWILAGIVSITILNILRIALIAMANHHDWEMITSLDPHESFNIATYICIFILFFIYMKYHKKDDLTPPREQKKQRLE